MVGSHDGGPELVLYPSREDRPNASADDLRIHPRATKHRIGLWQVFQVHGDEVQQSVTEKLLDDVGKRAVRVKLDLESKRSCLLDERTELVRQCGLSASDDHAAELATSRRQEGEDLVIVQPLTRRAAEQARIVAIGASEVASVHEKHGAERAREVDEATAAEARDDHRHPSAKTKLVLLLNSACLPAFHWDTGRR